MPAAKDLIHETSTSTGAGNLTVSEVFGRVRFSSSAHGFGTGSTQNVFDYYIMHRTAREWERGTGHMSDANTLVRDTVIKSSNGNAAVVFTAGTKDVTNDIPAGSSIFMDTGSTINWNSGDVVVTHSSNTLTFTGASSGYKFDAMLAPTASDGAALGSTSLMWSDAFLASGAVLNFNNGDVTITHSSNQLAIQGGNVLIGWTGTPAALLDIRGTAITGSLQLNYATSASSVVMSDNIIDMDSVDTAAVDTGAQRAVARQLGATYAGYHTSAYRADLRAGEFHVSRGLGVPFGQTFGIELGVHSEVDSGFVAGTAALPTLASAGIAISSTHVGWTNSGVRNDFGIVIAGTDGWKHPIRVEDTDGTSVLFDVSFGGKVFAQRLLIAPAASFGDPKMGADIFGTQGNPDASGSSPTAGVLRLQSQAGGFVIDAGSRATGNAWIQARLASNMATNYELELNPNGGNVRAGPLLPHSSDGAALGSASVMWSDLFLASGGVINWNNGDVTATHSANALAFAGASSGYSFDAKVFPASDDGAALGDATHNFSDLFLASGAVVNFNNGDVTVTHSANALAFAGASSGYSFDAVIAATTIDLGNADTTLSRPASGRMQIESEEVLTTKALTLTAAQQAQVRTNHSAALRGQIFGLTLSNNVSDATNDIDIAAGEAASTETNPVLMVLASALTKRLDASWAVGTNQGGLDTGSIADTTYFVWLIRRSDTGVVDALFSASASSPTMPANYDQKRRIGCIVRLSATIKSFVQDGDRFMWKSAVADISATNPGTAAVTRTLTVPVGVRVGALVCMLWGASAQTDMPGGMILTDLSGNDVAPTGNPANLVGYTSSGFIDNGGGGIMEIQTNTSAQIRSRVQISGANFIFRIATFGWVDTRGRFA